CRQREVKRFLGNAKIEEGQENQSRHAGRCVVISSGREGLLAVSEAAAFASLFGKLELRRLISTR
ncbi:MAG TPA: hypothetical protein VKO18_22590, partial [Terriglobia bacterium]|nr:hypothetical protein [Terriglobia bacterium]